MQRSTCDTGRPVSVRRRWRTFPIDESSPVPAATQSRCAGWIAGSSSWNPAAMRKPITLTYWPAANPPEVRLATRLAEQWNREHADVQVRVQPLPAGRSTEEVLLAAIVARATPDVSSNVSSALLARLVRAGGVVRLDTLAPTAARLSERTTTAMLALAAAARWRNLRAAVEDESRDADVQRRPAGRSRHRPAAYAQRVARCLPTAGPRYRWRRPLRSLGALGAAQDDVARALPRRLPVVSCELRRPDLHLQRTGSVRQRGRCGRDRGAPARALRKDCCREPISRSAATRSSTARWP